MSPTAGNLSQTAGNLTKYRAGGTAELLAVAIPLMISSGLESAMMIMDRVFLTWYSQTSVAASLPAGILFWTCQSLFHGTAGYVNTFVAQYEGSGRPDRVAAAMWQGIYFAMMAGAGLSLLALVGPTIFLYSGHTPEVQREEVIYFSILALGAIPTLLATVLGSFYGGRGQTHVMLYVSLISLFVDGALNFCLIFGWDPVPGSGFVFPRWGIAGAAVTTVIGQILACTIYLALMFRPQVKAYGLWANRWFDWSLFKQLMWFGIPGGSFLLIDVAGWTFFMFSLGWFGTRELAAANIAFNLNTAAFIPVIGLGIAVSTIVGNRIGEGRPELGVRTTWTGIAIGGAYMLFCGLIYVGIPDILLWPYSAWMSPEDRAEFAEVRTLVKYLLWFVAFYSLFDAMAIIFNSALRGAGDTVFTMLYTLGCSFGLLILPTIVVWSPYFRAWTEPTLGLCWTYCSIYIAAMGLGFCYRFQRGHWKKMSVIEQPVLERTAAVEPIASVPPGPMLTATIPVATGPVASVPATTGYSTPVQSAKIQSATAPGASTTPPRAPA